MGRQSKYEGDYTVTLVNLLARDGYTVEEIASELGVSKKTLYEWRKKYPELRAALKEGKDWADLKVVDSLYNRAIGCTITEKRTIIGTRDDGSTYPAKVEIIEKELAPDPTAMIYWLKNRRPDKWRDRREIDLSDEIAKTEELCVTIKRVAEEAANAAL